MSIAVAADTVVRPYKRCGGMRGRAGDTVLL